MRRGSSPPSRSDIGTPRPSPLARVVCGVESVRVWSAVLWCYGATVLRCWGLRGYPPDRELPGSPRQCSLPLACRHPPEGHQIGARKRRTPENTILSQPYCRRVSTDRPNREGSQLAASLEGEPGPTPAGKTLPHAYPETRFRRERVRGIARPCYFSSDRTSPEEEGSLACTSIFESSLSSQLIP